MDDVLNPTRLSSPHRVESEAIVPELVDSCLKEESKVTATPIKETSTPSSLMLNDDKMELFDRSTEIAQLKQAYQHLSLSQSIGHRKNIVLVSGEAGSGKTSVAKTLKENVDQDGGYFVSGSFDSMNMEPYHAFAAAFADFTNQVVARNEVTDMRNSIQKTVKSDSVMLVNVIPALQEILGDHQPPPDSSMLPSQDALMRFANTFQSLLSAIATPGRPLVIFLDDLHNADDCSLGLLTNLVSEVDSSDHILFVCTCSSELDKSNPVCEALRKIEDAHVQITDIAISNLGIDTISDMLSKLLGAPKDKSECLARGILMKTSGNALFVVEYVRKLHAHGLLYYDEILEQWTWDEEEIRRGLDNLCMESLLSSQTDNVPQPLMELLKVASCLGLKLQETVLSRAMSAPVSVYMEMAMERHFVVADKREAGVYVFTNGHVRDTFYRLVDENERPEFHLAVGRRLLRNFSSHELDKHVFVVLNQMRRGSHLVTSQSEKNTMASLCLLAGKKYVKASTFRPASICFKLGIRLLGTSSWKDEYDLTLDLFSSSAEVNYILSEFEQNDEILGAVLSNTREFRDQLRAWYVRVLTLGAQERASDAVSDGTYVLGKLGERLPKKPKLGLALLLEFRAIHRKLRRMSDEKILRFPDMTDPDKFAAMQMLNLMFMNAFYSDPNLLGSMSLRLVKLSLEHGFCGISSYGFAMFAMMAVGITNSVSEGIRYGDLALRIIDKYQAREWIPRVYVLVHGCLTPWKVRMAKTIVPLLQAYRIGQESGDVESAFVAANLYCFNSIYAGRSLPDIEREIAEFTSIMERRKHRVALTLMGPTSDLVRCLTGSVDYRDVLRKIGPRGDKDENNDDQSIGSRQDINYFLRCKVAYLFDDIFLTEKLTLNMHAQLTTISIATFEICQILSLMALVSISLVRSKSYKLAGPRTHMRIVRRTLGKLRKWVEENPGACAGNLFLLEAEMAALKGHVKKAHLKYKCALAMTQAEHLLLDHAIQGERAGRFMREQGDEELSREYYQEAHKTYVDWGAAARAEFLREKMERLFPGQKLLRPQE